MKYLFFFLLSFQTVFSYAKASADPCSEMSQIDQVVKCILIQDVKILDLKSQEQVASLKQGAASYFPNPKVSFEGGVGQSLGDTLTQFQVGMVLPIETGGKRGNRIALAHAELDQARVEKDLGTLEVLIDAFGRILKIKELHIQETSLKEALKFVQKVSKMYQSRPHLDPEQTASKHLFELMKQQYTYKLLLIGRDEECELHDLILMTQNKIQKEDLKKIIFALPAPQWPELKKSSAGNSLWVQKLKSEAIVNEKKYDYEVSQSFPDFEIGPYYSQDYQGPILAEFLGLSINFPLPIFNINSGGRALAKAAMESAIYKKKLIEIKEELELKFLFEDYVSMVEELNKLAPLLVKAEKSNPTMNLFERGLIPATFVVESQRSHQELIMTAHELELKTLEILFKIRSIQGNLDVEKISLWPKG
ncbi:MAG: TolC family protein [Pseudobdellovibrionaceae bacterium]